jgi:hypothetical protein
MRLEYGYEKICHYFFHFSSIVWTPTETLPMDLTQFRWKNRLLFILAEDDSHPLFKDLQRQIVAQKTEVDYRHAISCLSCRCQSRCGGINAITGS